MSMGRADPERNARIAADAAWMTSKALAKKYRLGQRQVQIILVEAGVRAQRSPHRPRPKTTKLPRMLEAMEAEYGSRR